MGMSKENEMIIEDVNDEELDEEIFLFLLEEEEEEL